MFVPAAALVVQQPTAHLHLNPRAATSSRTSVLRLVDASLAADTSAALVPAAQSSLTIWESAWDSHTLDTLVPDLLHTTMYAGLGLLGAYVTQGTEALETSSILMDFLYGIGMKQCQLFVGRLAK